jgi:uncharacterized protein (UPF0332 family)
MKELFKNKALENIKIAEIAFDNDCFNASANRAYYSAFHAAIAAIYSIGIQPNIDHKVIQSLFAENFCNRRKIVPSKYKSYLKDMQHIRSNADYRNGASKKDAKEQLKFAKEFVELILSVIV